MDGEIYLSGHFLQNIDDVLLLERGRREAGSAGLAAEVGFPRNGVTARRQNACGSSNAGAED